MYRYISIYSEKIQIHHQQHSTESKSTMTMVSNQSFYSEVGAAIVEPLPDILNIRIARSLESPCELASSCGVGLSMGIVRLRTRSSTS